MPGLTPTSIAPPFARYSHGFLVPDGHQILLTSGQLGLAKDGTIPEGAQAQAQICFDNINAILAAGGATARDTVKLTAYVTDRAHMQGYMAARDAWLAGVDTPPASTLVIVSGFTRPEFVVEIEVMAAVPT
jgi:enamine deaminase RidA (YjgF/YER057c/UK114 family)